MAKGAGGAVSPNSKRNIVQDLLDLGGKEWTSKGGEKRIYFNNTEDLFGLKIDRYKTGNIGSATLDGSKISNSRAADIVGALRNSQVYYDVGTQSFKYKMYASRDFSGTQMGDAIVQEIQSRLKAKRRT